MKSLRIFSLVALFTAVSMVAVAQTSTETYKVSGNCGMCKKAIEKAAKEAGATEAAWDKDTKELTVTYKSSTTNAAKIQQKVADAGYDNVGFKSTLEAYSKLPGCCKYERSSMDSNEAMMDCCKDGKCSKEGHDGKDCCKKADMKMPARTTGSDGDCCKDGKCTKEGHDGKDCCKKENSDEHKGHKH